MLGAAEVVNYVEAPERGARVRALTSQAPRLSTVEETLSTARRNTETSIIAFFCVAALGVWRFPLTHNIL